MRQFVLAAVAAAGLAGGPWAADARAADDHKDHGHTMTGVLIDNTCGAKQKDEAAAAKHPVKCTLKEACAASGYQLVVGDKHYKLTDAGNGKAKAYLQTAESSRVTIEGPMKGDLMDVTSIKAAPAHGDHKH